MCELRYLICIIWYIFGFIKKKKKLIGMKVGIMQNVLPIINELDSKFVLIWIKFKYVLFIIDLYIQIEFNML